MIPVPYYTTVYYIVISTAILLSTAPLLVKRDIASFPKLNLKIGTALILTITLAFIGLRNPWGSGLYFGDTAAYTRLFYRMQTDPFLNITKDIGFYAFMRVVGWFIGVSGFYLICALLYVIPVYLALKKWFKNHAFFGLVMVVSAMSFWAFGINGVRNGLATSLFIYALSLEKRLWKYGIMVIAITFHSSMVLPLVAYIIATFYKNTKALVYIWIFAIAISFFWGGQLETFFTYLLESMGLFDAGRIENLYTNKFEVAVRSFRPDFILYSAVPIALGYWYIFRKKYQNGFYRLLLNTYIIANTIWIFMIYAAFTNRIAYLSWFLYPILLCFPLLDQQDKIKNVQRNNLLIIMIVLSLCFTLLMEFK